MSVTLDEAVALINELGPNCALGVCCPPHAQQAILVNALSRCHDDDSKAAWILEHFDLAPKDSVTPLLRLAGRLARNE